MTLHRHRRTHEPRADGELGSYSDDDLENEENEFGALDEDSPPPDHSYLSGAMPTASSLAMSMGMPGTGMAAPSQLISAQHLLQQPI